MSTHHTKGNANILKHIAVNRFLTFTYQRLPLCKIFLGNFKWCSDAYGLSNKSDLSVTYSLTTET